jgi:hypothetical protein
MDGRKSLYDYVWIIGVVAIFAIVALVVLLMNPWKGPVFGNAAYYPYATTGTANAPDSDIPVSTSSSSSGGVSSYCGDTVCKGDEFVSCLQDCYFDRTNPVTLYDVLYKKSNQAGGDVFSFKLNNVGMPIDLNNYVVVFSGNGYSRAYKNFNYQIRPVPLSSASYLLAQGETRQFEITGSINAPLFAGSRSCGKLFRIGIFEKALAGSGTDEPGVALATSTQILPCMEAPVVCGNGIIEGKEQCDFQSLNGQTCLSLGFKTGTLSCTSDCMFYTKLCN